MKGFIIASPWIDLILAGRKTWELRAGHCRYHGEVGLIKKGTGRVWATARFAASSGPHDGDYLRHSFSKHLVPEEVWWSKEGWRHVWKLKDVRVLDSPVPYRHRPGAQNWVTLDEEVIEQMRKQRISSDVTSASDYRRIVNIESNGGIKNGYLCIGELIEWFPTDIVGGSNRRQPAKRTMMLHWGGPAVSETDIDGTKKFFRDRSWFPKFVRLHDLGVGDAVQFSRIGDYEYVASPIKAAILKTGQY